MVHCIQVPKENRIVHSRLVFLGNSTPFTQHGVVFTTVWYSCLSHKQGFFLNQILLIFLHRSKLKTSKKGSHHTHANPFFGIFFTYF